MRLETRKWLRRLLCFNQANRDKWIAHRAAETPAGAMVLDVGAGSCPYREFFAHCSYWTHDFQQLESVQLRGGHGYGRIDYVSDILAIPVADESVDLILCTEVLEHVSEPILVVSEFARLLKPGGRLLVTAPLGSGLHQEPYHYYGGYTPHWYQRFLTAAGFEHILIEPNGGFFLFWGQECQRCASKLAPWRNWRNALLFPFWLVAAPVLALIVPLMCQFLDHLDFRHDFTVGYHVSAIKRRR